MRAGALARGHARWAEVAAARAEFLRNLRKGVAYLTRRELVQHFMRWRERTPRRAGGNGAVASAMASVFGSGAARLFGYEETPEDRMRKCVLRIQNRELAHGWGKWAALVVEAAAQRAQIQARCSQAAHFLANSSLARGWRVWRDLHAQFVPLRRCMRHWVHSAVLRGWNAWAGKVAARNATLQTLRRCVGRMMHRQLASGFASWRRALSAKRAMQRLKADMAMKAAAYMLSNSLEGTRAAWLRWQGRYAERWKRRFWAEWALAHPIEPACLPQYPSAPPVKPGYELFDRIRPPRVANPHNPLMRVRPQRLPRRPNEKEEVVKKKPKPMVVTVSKGRFRK